MIKQTNPIIYYHGLYSIEKKLGDISFHILHQGLNETKATQINIKCSIILLPFLYHLFSNSNPGTIVIKT